MRVLGRMRTVLPVMFCLVALFLAPVRAGADGIVSIDTDKRYEGMKTSFAKGYLPSVKKNVMRLVVPFVVREPLLEDEILVGVSFEREENSPFVFRNYQKRVKRSGAGVFLYRCGLKLRKDRVSGQYPLHLTVRAQTGDGAVVEEFTVYTEITDGKAANASGEGAGDAAGFSEEEGKGTQAAEQTGADGEKKEEVDRQPRVLLTQSSLRGLSPQGASAQAESGGMESGAQGASAQAESGGIKNGAQGTSAQAESGVEENGTQGCFLQAGSSVVWTLTAKNCSSSQTIENMKVTLLYEGTDLSFERQAWYFERVAAGGSMDLSQVVTVGVKAAAGQALVQLQFEYEDQKGHAYSSTETARLSIRQVQQAQLSGLSFPESIFEADTDVLSFQVQNTGLAVLYNVRVSMEGAGLFPEGELFVGTVEPGTSADGEISVFAGTLDMDADGVVSGDGGEKYGDTAAKVYFSYEDEQGEVTRQEFSFHTAIKKPETVELTVEKPKEETNQWWITIVFFLFLLLILIIVGLYLRMKYYQRRERCAYEGTKQV